MRRSRSWKKPSPGQAQSGVQLSKDRTGDRADSGADHHAGDRRDREISQCRQLRLVLPLCGEPEDQQRQKKRPAIPKTVTSIWLGRLSRRPTSRSDTMRGSRASIRERNPRARRLLALKAVAHKLCRACYSIMKDQVAFDVTKAFA